MIEQASSVSRPWNPNSQIIGTRLGTLVGLSRIGVNWARVPAPGVAHHLRDPYEEDLIYLAGGEDHVIELE